MVRDEWAVSSRLVAAAIRRALRLIKVASLAKSSRPPGCRLTAGAWPGQFKVTGNFR